MKPESAAQVHGSVTRGYWIAIVGVVIWSTSAVFIRYLTENYDLPPLVLAAWRDAIACLTILLALRILKPSLLSFPRRHWRFFLLYGGLLSLFNALWTVSVALNGAAISTVLVYSSAGFTAIAAWRLFGETLNAPKITAVVLSLAGTVLVSGALVPGAWQANFLGVFTGLMSGIGFAAYSLFGKESARRGIHSWTALAVTFGIAAILLTAYNLLFPVVGGLQLGSRSLLPSLDLSGWVFMFLLAFGPTIGGYGLYNLSLMYSPASVVNLIATLEPSMTAAQSYLLLGERFTFPQVAGSLLIIAGVVLLRWMEARAGQPAPRLEESNV